MTAFVASGVDRVRELSPLVHNVTNLVAMTFSANVLIAAGASPIMATAPEEAGELAGISAALVVNMGTLTRDAIDEQLARRVPLYRALLFRRAHGLDGVPVYALHGERLHDFAGPALLGEWSGPHRYALVLPLLDRPEELAARLRGLGAQQLLLPRRLISASGLEKVAASEAFRELYRDDESLLLEIAHSGS